MGDEQMVGNMNEFPDLQRAGHAMSGLQEGAVDTQREVMPFLRRKVAGGFVASTV